MTINASSPSTGITSCMLDADTIARIALACAGVSGDPTVAVAIETFGGAAPFVAAVHDGRDGAAALSPLTRQRVRAFASVFRVTASADPSFPVERLLALAEGVMRSVRLPPGPAKPWWKLW